MQIWHNSWIKCIFVNNFRPRYFYAYFGFNSTWQSSVTERNKLSLINWLRLSRMVLLYKTLLSEFDDPGRWFKSLLLDASPPTVCAIFRSGLAVSQISVRWTRSRFRQTLHLTTWEITLHTVGGETSSRNDFNHRTRLSSPDKSYIYCSWFFLYSWI